jgi:hypothetical protein
MWCLLHVGLMLFVTAFWCFEVFLWSGSRIKVQNGRYVFSIWWLRKKPEPSEAHGYGAQGCANRGQFAALSISSLSLEISKLIQNTIKIITIHVYLGERRHG